MFFAHLKQGLVWLWLCSLLSACDFFPAKHSREPEDLSPSTLAKRRELFAPFAIEVFADRIETPHGKSFSLLTWESELHQKIAWKVESPARASEIVEKYQAFLSSALKNHKKLRKSLEQWLIDHALYLGSLRADPMALVLVDVYLKTQLEKYPSIKLALERFFAAVAYPLEPREPKNLDHLNVVILTTSIGGGHFSVATALEGYLRKNTAYNISVVDEKLLQLSYDPLWLATDEWTADLIYERVFQQSHNAKKAHASWQAWSELRHYIPWTRADKRLECIKKYAPDIIISVNHFQPEQAVLAYALDVPCVFIATDYYIPREMREPLLNFSSQLVEYWLPISEKEIFSSYQDGHYFSDNSNPSEINNHRLLAIAEVLNGKSSFEAASAKLEGAFKLFGYPLRESFETQEESDLTEATLARLRAQLRVAEDEKVILVGMGKAGVGRLEALVHEVNQSREHIHEKAVVFVLCGSNTELKNRLETYFVEAVPETAKLRFKALSLLSQKDMAEYYRLADVFISKAGGAATAEVAHTQVPTLVFSEASHSWENGNKNFLIRQNLGVLYKPEQPLAQQIQDILTYGPKRGHSRYQSTDWKAKLLPLIEAKIAAFEK